MGALKLYFADRLRHDPRVISAVLINYAHQNNPLIDNFDMLLLVVTEHKEPINYISHYIKEPYRIQERWIHKRGIDSWILNGDNRNIIHWVLQGEILLDQDQYFESLRQQLIEFPQPSRQRKLFIEFSYFLRKYLQCKAYMKEGHYLDAYSSILESLLHWGRISIIEYGAHPEVTVWQQLRKINPGIYKLYEELTMSQEPLPKRVELVRLACEFSVMSKMKDCCQTLFDVLNSRKEPWSASELKEHPDLADLYVELTLTLKKLVKKSLIREVVVPIDQDLGLMELRYTSI